MGDALLNFSHSRRRPRRFYLYRGKKEKITNPCRFAFPGIHFCSPCIAATMISSYDYSFLILCRHSISFIFAIPAKAGTHLFLPALTH